MTFLNVMHLLCRLLLALSFLVFAIDGLTIASVARHHGLSGFYQGEWIEVTILSALMMSISIWLVIGLRSRMVALLGLVIFAGLHLWFSALGLQTTYGVWHLAISSALAAPLLVLGGGRFAIYRRGWQVPV